MSKIIKNPKIQNITLSKNLKKKKEEKNAEKKKKTKMLIP